MYQTSFGKELLCTWKILSYYFSACSAEKEFIATKLAIGYQKYKF